MELRELLVESAGGVCTITLNRPGSMNSLNLRIVEALAEAVAALRFDRSVRVAVITGAGEKAFCSGADLKERATLPPDQVRRFIATIRDTFTAIEALPQPVIAAVNGVALGGGTELALACDLRIASDRATLGLTEVKLAIIPGAGGTQRLPRLIGKGRAMELILTGRSIGAAEALAIGLVNRVAPAGGLMEAVRKLAGEMLSAGPVALQQAKLAINQGYETDLATGLKLETAAYEAVIPTRDRAEGLAAFAEKRKPVYKGE
ncbi:MAG: echA2 [Deltaproteobacteria bacterium]|jgi:enoyl-CoA hydratase/carnithine racemase|nr:echA2 [Deltaproteobacteria bacterium]